MTAPRTTTITAEEAAELREHGKMRRPVVDPSILVRDVVRSDDKAGSPHLVVEPMTPIPIFLNQHGAVCAVTESGRLLGIKPGEFDFACPIAAGRTYLDGCWRIDVAPWQILSSPTGDEWTIASVQLVRSESGWGWIVDAVPMTIRDDAPAASFDPRGYYVDTTDGETSIYVDVGPADVRVGGEGGGNGADPICVATGDRAFLEAVVKLLGDRARVERESRATVDAEYAARGIRLYRAPQPFCVDSVIDQVACDVTDEFDDAGDHIVDQITRALESNRARVDQILAEAWDRIVDEAGAHAELALVDDDEDPALVARIRELEAVLPEPGWQERVLARAGVPIEPPVAVVGKLFEIGTNGPVIVATVVITEADARALGPYAYRQVRITPEAP